jgi:hypothetical protein
LLQRSMMLNTSNCKILLHTSYFLLRRNMGMATYKFDGPPQVSAGLLPPALPPDLGGTGWDEASAGSVETQKMGVNGSDRK